MTAHRSDGRDVRGDGAGLSAEVIILGAGVIGVTTAYALARRGRSVALVDRMAQPACGASFANGAQLSYTYADPLGGPALLKNLPSLLLGADPLFQVKGVFDPAMVAWGLRFLRSCTRERQRAGVIATLALALESQRAMHALLERHPLAFGYGAPGKMLLYFDHAAFAGASDAVELKKAHGADQHTLSPAEARAIEPALDDLSGLQGVVYSPADEVGDAHRFCSALVEVLRRDYGVQTLFGVEARDVSFDDGGLTVLGAGGEQIRGERLVVALGEAAAPFLRRLGVQAPIMPMKGYSFTAPPGPHSPRVSLTDTARKIVFCRLAGAVRVAGGAELGARNADVEPERLGRLLTTARSVLPQAADYENATGGWAGMRPMTPSSIPIIAKAGERLVLNIGHGMLGWTLAMGSAERAAALAAPSLGSRTDGMRTRRGSGPKLASSKGPSAPAIRSTMT